ncbi:MAG TPA: hypothetical protein VK980_18080 [Sphingomonas sp.]|nr:hypothetical protein [Sphingomonas sp.]
MPGCILSAVTVLIQPVSGGYVVVRNFFNLVDDGREDDDGGMELQGAAAARVAGISHAGSVLRNEPHLLDGGRLLCVEVTGDAGQRACKVVMSVVEEAVPAGGARAAENARFLCAPALGTGDWPVPAPRERGIAGTGGSP